MTQIGVSSRRLPRHGEVENVGRSFEEHLPRHVPGLAPLLRNKT